MYKSINKFILKIRLFPALKGSTRFLSRTSGGRRSTFSKLKSRFGSHWITSSLNYGRIKRSSRSVLPLSSIRLYIGLYKVGSRTRCSGRSRSSGSYNGRIPLCHLYIRAFSYVYIGYPVYMYWLHVKASPFFSTTSTYTGV